MNKKQLRELIQSMVMDNYTDEEIRCIMENHFTDFSLKLQDHKFKLPYRTRNKDFKMATHWGQRKLLMSCIQFLNKYEHLAKTVVYAGAAPGTNVLVLAEMFPGHHFHLYDPRDFDSDLNGHERISIFQDYFTNDTASKYTKKKVLFWSDIRTGCINDDDFEEQIQENNKMQEKWHKIMKPEFAMYKFRLPYAKGHTEYMRGQIWLQVWAPETSTETRLVVRKNNKTKMYSHSKYEKRMYYFNLITRQWGDYAMTYDKTKYLEKYPLPCLCTCFDCRSESEILKSYLEKFKDTPKERMINSITQFSKKISKALSITRTLYIPPHGLLANHPMIEKYTELRKYKVAVMDRASKKKEYRNKQYHKNVTRGKNK